MVAYKLEHPLFALGFDPGRDQIVGAVQSELEMYTSNSADAMKIWGWDPAALTAEDHYKLDRLIRMFTFQRGQILAAFDRLNREYGEYLASSPDAAAQDLDFRIFLVEDTARAFMAWLDEADRAGKGEPVSDIWFPAKWRDRLMRTGDPANSANQVLLELARPDSTGEDRKELLAEAPYILGEAARNNPAGYAVSGVVSFMHPAVARNLGFVPSLAMGGFSFSKSYWRLKDNGYPREWIADGRLYDLIDLALALQAELQLQYLLTDREFTNLIDRRGYEFEWLKAEAARKAAAEAAAGTFWGVFGDILGIVSAVSGVLALIPIFTPIAGPIAAVTAIASLGAHTVDAAIKGDWDAATFVGLAADALAALPGVGAVAKSLKAGKAITKTIGTGAKASYRASVGVRRAGLTFLAETGGKGASEASSVFNYIGTKGAKIVKATEQTGKIAGKVLQGAVNLSTQIPLAVEMAAGGDMTNEKYVASGTALTANYGQTIGSWGPVGSAAKKAGTVSLATFAKIIGRR
ncbi:hypothetical protein [Kitasatospora sp. NPDC094011]|uniref:hypothetical protein n=1 Tax=Kitasatospora sp. NPDC094011 TaxID=3364090 RepID=UPI00382766B3